MPQQQYEHSYIQRRLLLLHFKVLGKSKVFGGALIKPGWHKVRVSQTRPEQFSTVTGQFNPQ